MQTSLLCLIARLAKLDINIVHRLPSWITHVGIGTCTPPSQPKIWEICIFWCLNAMRDGCSPCWWKWTILLFLWRFL